MNAKKNKKPMNTHVVVDGHGNPYGEGGRVECQAEAEARNNNGDGRTFEVMSVEDYWLDRELKRERGA